MIMPEGKEEELSKPPEDIGEEFKEIMEELERRENSFAAKTRRLSQSISRETNAIELEDYHNEGLDRAQKGTNNPANIAVSDQSDASDRVIQELHASLEEATKKIAQAPTAEKTFNLQRFMAAVGLVALAATITNILYTAIHNAQNNQPAPAPLPADTAAQIRELVRQWNAEPDSGYWEDLATYVTLPSQSPPLTLADQILFMSYTADLSPAHETWIWQTGTDITTLVTQLVDAYNGAQSTASMYRFAATLTYNGNPIPRGVMATLLRYALTQILINANPALAAAAATFARTAAPAAEGEEHVTEPPADEESAAEEEAAEAQQEADSFAEHNAQTTEAIATQVKALELSTVNCQNVESAWAEPVAVANSAIADPAPDPRLTELQSKLQEISDKLSAKTDTKPSNGMSAATWRRSSEWPQSSRRAWC